MDHKIVHILWTGGLDSTYRMVELSGKECVIQPHYVIVNRKNIKNELEELKRLGYDQVLKKVRTCFRPVFGMPCGHCFACQSARYEGAGELIPKVGYMLGSIRLYFNKILSRIKKLLKRILPQKVYNVLRGIYRKCLGR